MYTPTALPIDVDQLSLAVQREFERVAQEMRAPAVSLLLQTTYVRPLKPRDGTVVLADGVKWNPGSGAGFYGYRGAVWVLLG